VRLGQLRDFDMPGIRSTSDEQNQGRQAFRALLDAIEDHPGHDEPLRSVLNTQRGWLSRRALAFAVSEPVLVRITKNRMLNVWPEPRDQDIRCLLRRVCRHANGSLIPNRSAAG